MPNHYLNQSRIIVNWTLGIVREIYIFSLKETHLKMSGIFRPSCLDLNVLIYSIFCITDFVSFKTRNSDTSCKIPSNIEHRISRRIYACFCRKFIGTKHSSGQAGMDDCIIRGLKSLRRQHGWGRCFPNLRRRRHLDRRGFGENNVYPSYRDVLHDRWPLLLTWVNFSPSMDK